LSNYASGGGGMGGCEDPRLTKIGERIYMTYVAYDGQSHPRVALTSISTKDFRSKKWNWKKPVLISPPDTVDKNACILPEKINGKFVIFHRVFPNILIDFVDDLNFDGKTRWLEGKFKIPTRTSSSDWDNLKVGCGPPPIKTKDGWLMIYQAVSSSDESRYKMGAMLLDLKDPTKVLARTRSAILEPTAAYEKEGWKAGVIYPCGAVVIKERLFVYYGGADKFVCVASVKLKHLLNELKTNHKQSPLEIQPLHQKDTNVDINLREKLAEHLNSIFIAALLVLSVVAITINKKVKPSRSVWWIWAIGGLILVSVELLIWVGNRSKMRYANRWWLLVIFSVILMGIMYYLSGIYFGTNFFVYLAGILLIYSIFLGAMLVTVLFRKINLDKGWGKLIDRVANWRQRQLVTVYVFLLSVLSAWVDLWNRGLTSVWMSVILILGFIFVFIVYLAYL
jgi:predicted GH43/DUF377 family glycosyl hydrolase